MAKGSLLGWGLRRACMEWVRIFGTDHISWHSLPRLASWWANSILASGHGALGIVFLYNCGICLRVALLTHTELPNYLSIWGMDPQKIVCRGGFQLGWIGRPVSRFYLHVCFLWAGLLFGDSSQFHGSTLCLPAWRCKQAGLQLRKWTRGGQVTILLLLREV